jgi:hypothetical protein
MRIASVVCFWLSAIAAHAAAPSLAQRVLVVYNPGLADSAAVAIITRCVAVSLLPTFVRFRPLRRSP